MRGFHLVRATSAQTQRRRRYDCSPVHYAANCKPAGNSCACDADAQNIHDPEYLRMIEWLLQTCTSLMQSERRGPPCQRDRLRNKYSKRKQHQCFHKLCSKKRAQARGVRFGRPLKLSQYQIAVALSRRANGERLVDIGRSYGVSHSTISRL